MNPSVSKNDYSKVIFGVCLFVGVLFWRSPHLFLQPRFWAEEATDYYSIFQNQGFFLANTLVVHGNFQLLTNWVTYSATWVPAEFAAHVTTYLALLVTVVFSACVGVLAVQERWSWFNLALVTSVLALLPHGYELYLTATNMQWILSACILLILIIRVDDWGHLSRASLYGLTVVAGLTGVCSVMLAPAFLLRKKIQPSSFHFRLGLILAVCAVVHLLIIVNHSQAGRSFQINAFLMTFPLLLQSIWTPLAGVRGVQTWIAFLSAEGGPVVWILLIYLISCSLVLFFASVAKKVLASTGMVYILLACWLGVSTLNIFGLIGDPVGLISPWAGTRYFFLGAVVFVLLLGISTASPSVNYSRLASLLLCLMVINGVSLANWRGAMRGPSWQFMVQSCEGERPCTVQVWPGGPDGAWTFKLYRP